MEWTAEDNYWKLNIPFLFPLFLSIFLLYRGIPAPISEYLEVFLSLKLSSADSTGKINIWHMYSTFITDHK